MSYEGRECFICPNVHIVTCDCYESMYYGEEGLETVSKTCPYCKEKMDEVGAIDDTNGEALCMFKLTEITPELRKTNAIKLDDFTTITTVVYRPGTYSVVKDKLCRNFDTGEEYIKLQQKIICIFDYTRSYPIKGNSLYKVFYLFFIKGL